MRTSPNVDGGRRGHVAIAALAAGGAALLAAAALATYDASLAKAHAVREAVPPSPERAPSALRYLPSSSQIGTLPEPLMTARRAALRAGFAQDEAPLDAFDRLRSVPGHDEEARSLLSQFWERKAMLADDPVRRVLYVLQARIVDDDDGNRLAVASAMAALGPLRRARHVAEGTVLSADDRTLVLQGSGWLHVLNLDAGTSFDLSDSDAGKALVDGRRLLTWDDATARMWDLDAAPTAPVASFKLLPGETPLSFAAPSGQASAGACAVTSEGRVWRADGGAGPVTVARGRWAAGSMTPTCDRLVLQGARTASYRRRGGAWMAEPVSTSARPAKGSPFAKPEEVQVEACAARAPRCVLRDPAGVRSVWDFGSSPPRRLYEGVDCEAKRFSPDGTRLMCRASQDRITLYSEDEAGKWNQADLLLPPLTGVFLQDDASIVGTVPSKDPAATDRADVLFFAPTECWAPPPVERAWASIRMFPNGVGALFTFKPAAQGAPGYSSFLEFDSKGESLAAASSAWFGERNDEQLFEHDATDSAGEKTYELAGAPFDPAGGLGPLERVPAVQIDDAFFVESPAPSVIFELAYTNASPDAPASPLRAVARWDLRAKRFCGPAVPGALNGVSPTGDAIAVQGRIYKVGPCTPEGGFESTDATGVVAVGPGAMRWIAREGESLRLHGPQREPSPVPSAGPRGDKPGEAQIEFSRDGDRFFVRTARTLCDWVIRDDGALDLDGCRWSTAGWASDASWARADKGRETVMVFDRTAEGAAIREFFGGQESIGAAETGGSVACGAIPRPEEPPLAVLQQWQERLGHRFKEQATTPQDAREMSSSEIAPADAPGR